jgi:putative flippase GtrA
MKQFAKYLVVGGGCSLVYIAAGNLAAVFAPPLAAAFIAYLASGIAGYFAQMRITFATTADHRRMAWKYAALSLLMLAYGEAITHIGTELGIRYLWISVFVAGTIPLFSFPMQKFWVYK